jgi:predicted RNA-binding Zn ribbon-like protein
MIKPEITGRQMAVSTLIPTVRKGLCLDYVNTLSWRGSETPSEGLGSLDDLIAWLVEAGALADNAARQQTAWSRAHRASAAKLFDEAIAIRELSYRTFSALASQRLAREQDFAALNDALAAAPARTRLAHFDGGYAWHVEPRRVSASTLLAPVLWSAADLMVAGEREQLRQCANEKCLWLFLDESKSRTRRWCDMASCGNRAKARRHYLKMKQG